MAKRLLCVVLSVLMIIAVLPTGVVAEDTSGLPTTGTVSASTYTLTDDVTLTGALTIAANTEVTIDLAGHTIYTYQGSISANAITVNGTLNIKDSSSSGMITSSGTTANVSYSMITVKTGGTLNFESGTLANSSLVSAVSVDGGILNVSGGTISNTKASYYAVKFNSGTVVINGGTITTSGKDSWAIYGNNASNTGTVTINGGTFSNTYTKASNGSTSNTGGVIRTSAAATTWTINDGTFSSYSGYTVYTTSAYLTINGGSYSSDIGYVVYINNASTDLTISGGTFTSGTSAYAFGSNSQSSPAPTYSGTITITGGIYSSSNSSDTSISTVLEACCDEDSGTTYTKNTDGSYMVTTTVVTLPTFYGKNIVLAGEIGVKFYVDFTDVDETDWDSYSVQFTVDGAEADTVAFSSENSYSGNSNVYYFQCDVACWEMGAEITAQIMKDGTEVGDPITYSVADYVSNRNTNSTNTNFVDLLNAMLNFGYYTEQYYTSTVGTLSGTTLSSNVVTTGMSGEFDLSGYAATLSESNTLEVKAGLVLDTIVELRFYVPTSESTTYTVKIDGTEVSSSGTYTSGEVTYNYYTTDANTLVQNWDYGHSIEVTDSTGTVVYSATGYSVMSYANTVLTDSAYSSYTDLQNLVKAMYLYNQAANTYLGLN